MADSGIRKIVEQAIERENGILPLRPCWVARDFIPPGRRLGLREDEYAVGDRGFICERWIGSETRAENRIGPEDEGLSYLDIEGENILLKDAVGVCGPRIMGASYAKTHQHLGRLPKIYDFESRIFYHIHQKSEDARKVGKNPKEEAYYFLEGADMGKHPETFFGVHPYIVDRGIQYDTLLPYLVDWNSDLILKHARAYLNVAGEGFHLPSGVLHAPGTALTLELQEASDVFAMLQAQLNGVIHSKELLFKDVSKEDRQKHGELAVLKQIDWKICGDPYFYENRHTDPKPVQETVQEGGSEQWIFYNTTKFSGKKVRVKPKSSFRSVDRGVYNVLVWQGSGRIDGHQVEGGRSGIDEVLVTHEKAVQGFTIQNTGKEELLLFKFFGPDINTDVPYLPVYKP
jgi:hypothetical protein